MVQIFLILFHGIDPVANPAGLAQALWNMNERAYNARYSESPVLTMFQFRTVFPERFQLLKSLDCYLYQCAEGDIPETDSLYKTLDKYRESLRDEIISELPEYAAAKWE